MYLLWHEISELCLLIFWSLKISVGWCLALTNLLVLWNSNFRVPVAYCDAGATLSDDYISNLRSASLKIFQNDAVSYSAKEYTVELKPLFSAFELKNFTLTTFRSFLINFLPLAEPRANLESDDEDFLEDTEEQQRVDYVVPLKKSLKQIARDVSGFSCCHYCLFIGVVNYISSYMMSFI